MCFMAFGNHDFLDSKKKHCIRNYSKVKGEIFRAENFAEFSFAMHDPTHGNLFWKKIKSVLDHDPQKFIRQSTMFLGGLMFLGVLNDNSKS